MSDVLARLAPKIVLSNQNQIFFSEFGTDSFYTTKWWPAVGRVDEIMQAAFLRPLIDEMYSHSFLMGKGNSCLGGTVFAWNDEWWKVQEQHGGQAGRQDKGGFPTPWNKYSHPDSFANEEYFGIVKLNREPKQAFLEVRDAYANIKQKIEGLTSN